MTALIVIGAIALLIFILLASSVTVDMEYDTVFKYKVRYLFFTFINNPESPRQIKKRQKKEQKKKQKAAQLKQPADDKTQKKEANKLKKTETAKQEQDKPAETAPKKPKMKFSLDLIKRIFGRTSPHVKRLFKKIRLSRVIIDITTGGDDAAKTAISYGVHCAAVYGLVTFLDSVISFKADEINVKADFSLPKNRYHVRATLKLRLSTLLHSGIWGFFAVLSELRKDSGAPPEKNAAEQKNAA